MKITKKHNDGTTAFYNLDAGDVFLFNNCAYLKINQIDSIDEDNINAVRLDTGEIYDFNSDERVKLVNAELIMEV